jgi:hypothetical protein
MGTLIDPYARTVQADKDFTPEPVYLRNPQTGIIFKLWHIDTIKRCQAENYLPSSEEAMLAQSAEMYEVQGRVYPPREPEPMPSPSASSDDDEPDTGLTVHERNRRAALQRKR